jgi:hypothetical protein
VGPKRAAPFLALLAVSFPLWLFAVRQHGGGGVLDHSPVDQHARQAQAWLQGRLDLGKKQKYLEIAEYRGRYFDSFPPTPTLVELPLTLAFGKQTPNSLALYLCYAAALCAMHGMARRRGFPERDAVLLALAFVFGTNLYASAMRANVWAWGQGLGFCLAVLATERALQNPRGGWRGPGPGYLLLALAVGCRPFYVFVFPLLAVLDIRTSGRRLARVVVSAVLWAAPVAAGLAWLNWARFDNPLEFGHNHLAWAHSLPQGIFSLGYLPRNLFHATLRMPDWVNDFPPLEFDPWGTAFWLNNGIFLAALWALVREPFDRWVRAAAGLALALTWWGLLLHQTNGWRQFGYRFLIDLLPIGFVVVVFAYRRTSRPMLAAFLWSLAVNLYGLLTWKEMPRPY